MTPSAKEAPDPQPLVDIAVLREQVKFFKQQCDERDQRLKLMETQIEELQRKKQWLLGAVAAITFVWPFISHKLGEVIGIFHK